MTADRPEKSPVPTENCGPGPRCRRISQTNRVNSPPIAVHLPSSLPVFIPSPIFLPVADALDIAKACALHADQIKAEDIVILDLRGLSSITDYFVICNGTSNPHLKAIRRDISEKVLETLGEKPRSVDGDPESQWLVLDYVNVIVHVFHADKRHLYGLETLWKDAPRVPLDFLPVAPSAFGASQA
ncbi:MAG: ribosome silencing factor [Verrucomicrobiales bacterium]|nr:ribosome silencing factor [Verrucomicrobiales bacterium]